MKTPEILLERRKEYYQRVEKPRNKAKRDREHKLKNYNQEQYEAEMRELDSDHTLQQVSDYLLYDVLFSIGAKHEYEKLMMEKDKRVVDKHVFVVYNSETVNV